MYKNLFCLTVLFFADVTFAFAQDFYVSPMGNDQADGLSAETISYEHGPFLTLARAQAAIRALKPAGAFKEAVNVHIAKGLYLQNKPLMFDIRDTGFVGREINWLGEDSASTVISGGVQLSNCSAEQGNLWQCPVSELVLPGQKSEIPIFNLFVNEQRLHLARWPDNDWAHVKLPLDEKSTFTSMEQLPTVINEGVQIHIYPSVNWSDQYLPVSIIDHVNNRIKLASNADSAIVSGARYYLENIRSELNTSGKWFYDQTHAKIEFVLANKAQAESVFISAIDNLITLHDANYISFKNIRFSHTLNTPIVLKNSHHINLDGIEINNVDQAAINAENSTYFVLASSNIHDVGTTGVSVEGGDRKTLTPSNNLIINNHFHHLGQKQFTWTPAISVNGVGAKMLHNLVEYLPGTGISINGNNHLFENNEVHHICQQSGDCGAIYSGRNWTWRGNIIQSNYIHDIHGYGLQHVNLENNTVEYGEAAAVGVYLDDGMSGYTVNGNVFVNAGTMSIQIGGGRDNHIENNFIFTEKYAIFIDNRGPNYDWNANNVKTLDTVPYKSPIWLKQYPELALPIKHNNWPEGNIIRRNIILSNAPDNRLLLYQLPARDTEINNNLVWSLKGDFKVVYSILDSPYLDVQSDWQAWLIRGIEKNSLYADPCVNLAVKNITFCHNSPINKIKFKPLSRQMGLIK